MKTLTTSFIYVLLIFSICCPSSLICQETKEVPAKEEKFLKSGNFFENVNSLNITTGKERITLQAGDKLIIKPKEDKELEIPSEKPTRSRPFVGSTEVNFNIQLNKPSDNLHYLIKAVYLTEEGYSVIFSIPKDNKANLWPKNKEEVETSISIRHNYSGSGFIYIFLDDGSYIEKVGLGNIKVDEMLKNMVILSNIIKQPIRFVNKP